MRLEGARLVAAEQRGIAFRQITAQIDGEQIGLPPLFDPPGIVKGFCGLTHALAMAVLEQARPHRMAGRDFSCIGFSSIPDTDWGGKMDIMAMDFTSVGESGMSTLLDQMEGKDSHRTILIPLKYQAWGTTRSGAST